jgi:hypothetical protein
MAMVMAVAAVVVVADAEAEAHGSDVGAENVGACRRPAEQAQGEDRGDQEFHGVSSGIGSQAGRKLTLSNGPGVETFHCVIATAVASPQRAGVAQAAFASRASSFSTRSAALRRCAGVAHSPLITTFWSGLSRQRLAFF